MMLERSGNPDSGTYREMMDDVGVPTGREKSRSCSEAFSPVHGVSGRNVAGDNWSGGVLGDWITG